MENWCGLVSTKVKYFTFYTTLCKEWSNELGVLEGVVSLVYALETGDLGGVSCGAGY